MFQSLHNDIYRPVMMYIIIATGAQWVLETSQWTKLPCEAAEVCAHTLTSVYYTFNYV